MARGVKGLWFVQLLEYGIGFAVASTAAHAQRPAFLVLLALILIANAACVNGPLSAFRITNAVVHRSIGIAIAVGVLSCALFLPLDVNERLTLVAVAGAEAFVSVRFGHGI
jgi:hypothetical protein